MKEKKTITELIEDNSHILLSSFKMRKIIGILGMILPLLLYFGVMLTSKYNVVQHSISLYFYTFMGGVLIATLAMLSIYLFTYQGPKNDSYYKWDNWITNIAGLSIIIVALFPTNSASIYHNESFVVQYEKYHLIDLHNPSAAIFFLSISCMSFFLFTRSGKEGNKAKKIQWWIYKFSGVIMFLCCILIVFMTQSNNEKNPEYFLGIPHPVFWLEVIALEAFGISWFVKGLDYRIKDTSINNQVLD